MPTTTHADPQEQLAGLPVMLRELCENIFGRLSDGNINGPEEGKRFLSDISKAAGEGKDLSRAALAFLAAELREMPKKGADIDRYTDPATAHACAFYRATDTTLEGDTKAVRKAVLAVSCASEARIHAAGPGVTASFMQCEARRAAASLPSLITAA